MPTWTDPADFSVGEFPTAAKLTAILNNFDCLKCGARVTHSVDQSIANNTNVVLAFDTERYDTDTIHDNATNNSRLTCKTAGKYLIQGNIDFAVNATGYRHVEIIVNGAGTIARVSQDPVSTTSGVRLVVSCEYALAVNDYVELQVYQSSGGALNVTKLASYSPEFSMHFLGG